MVKEETVELGSLLISVENSTLHLFLFNLTRSASHALLFASRSALTRGGVRNIPVRYTLTDVSNYKNCLKNIYKICRIYVSFQVIATPIVQSCKQNNFSEKYFVFFRFEVSSFRND